ncbi:hypothetical protein P7K49_020952 [Saguinus oedipus]|uniref:USP domain-containing protein n=1 Tax=Saguinus oedipus TaxID=9490 RepID=A0ABQ9UR92_SAGOE|nr:hypothetical protein P7K49_020952 [Saguinus oedipus]
MGGHYTAYCRSPGTGEWHTFNDSSHPTPTPARLPLEWTGRFRATKPLPVGRLPESKAGFGARLKRPAGVSGSCPLSGLTPRSLRSVTPMSSSQVRTSDAYLLFYELASPPSRM